MATSPLFARRGQRPYEVEAHGCSDTTKGENVMARLPRFLHAMVGAMVLAMGGLVASAPQGSQELGTIVRGLQYREGLVESAMAFFDVAFRPTEDPWYAAKWSEKGNKPNPGFHKVFWALDGEKVRQDEVLTFPEEPGLDRDTQTAYDGNYGYYLDRTRMQGEQIAVGAPAAAERYWGGPWPWLEICPRRLIRAPLSERLREHGELIGRETINEAETYHIRITSTRPAGGNFTEEWWIAPTYGFLPIKHVISVALEDPEVKEKIVTASVTEVLNLSETLWVPRSTTETIAVHLRDDRIAVGYITTYTLFMMQVNQSLAPKTFQLEYPPGATVRIDGETLEIDSHVLDGLEEIAPLVTPEATEE